jgi:hypothetical protein
MKYLMTRPSLFVWAVALAMFFARAGGHHGGHGFHQW